jgi:hypothetical protein
MDLEKTELIARADEWARNALPPSPWSDKHIVFELIAALTATLKPFDETQVQDTETTFTQ